MRLAGPLLCVFGTWVCACGADSSGQDDRLFQNGTGGTAGTDFSRSSGGLSQNGGSANSGAGGIAASAGGSLAVATGGVGVGGAAGNGNTGGVGGVMSGGNAGRGGYGGYGAYGANGGALGGGGLPVSGGAPGSGGLLGSGGTLGSGGLLGSGGSLGSGGATGTGCSVASGGTLGSGGAGRGGFGNFGNNGGFGNGGGSADFSRPLVIPGVLGPTSKDATTDYYGLTVKTGTVQMTTGALTPIVGFNGLFPGPTIVATKGRAVQVVQTNAWTENITIHNHGHKVAAASDGHPVDYILPGASKTYTYPNDQRAGTYWYHDHTMDLTGPHVYKGIAAFYLIHDPAEDALNLPSGTSDVPLLLQDKTLTSANALSYDASSNRQGFLGSVPVVNGVVTPHLDVASHKYRFRILNGSNARNFRIQLGSGKSFQVIASDGGLLAAPVSRTALDVAPAERYDIVIDFAPYGVGATDVLTNTDGDSPSIGDLMQFRVTTCGADSSTVPATLSSIVRYQASQAVSTTQLTLSQRQDWTINGLTYDSSRIDVTSKSGSIYIWTLVNETGEMHPFHKHLTEFQVLDIGGSAPPLEQSGWKDTVAVPARGQARIIFKNEGFTGTYVFHCHRLEHEDHRMMLQESVVP